MIYVRTPWVRQQNEPVDQPVDFDHRHHSQDDGIDCVYCHTSVFRAGTAGIPSTDKCMGCHSQVWSQSVMLEPVLKGLFLGDADPVEQSPRSARFRLFQPCHSREQGVGCSTCHGRVNEMAQVYQVAPLTMGWCLDCHRAPSAHLRPLSRITDMSFRPEAQDAAVRARLARELGVQSLTDCSACHR